MVHVCLYVCIHTVYVCTVCMYACMYVCGHCNRLLWYSSLNACYDKIVAIMLDNEKF